MRVARTYGGDGAHMRTREGWRASTRALGGGSRHLHKRGKQRAMWRALTSAEELVNLLVARVACEHVVQVLDGKLLHRVACAEGGVEWGAAQGEAAQGGGAQTKTKGGWGHSHEGEARRTRRAPALLGAVSKALSDTAASVSAAGREERRTRREEEKRGSERTRKKKRSQVLCSLSLSLSLSLCAFLQRILSFCTQESDKGAVLQRRTATRGEKEKERGRMNGHRCPVSLLSLSLCVSPAVLRLLHAGE